MLNVLKKAPEFFHRKLKEFNKPKISTLTSKSLLALFKVAYRIAE
jgi:hypothetical protein